MDFHFTNFTSFCILDLAHIWLIILCEIVKVTKHETAMNQNSALPELSHNYIYSGKPK